MLLHLQVFVSLRGIYVAYLPKACLNRLDQASNSDCVARCDFWIWSSSAASAKLKICPWPGSAVKLLSADGGNAAVAARGRQTAERSSHPVSALHSIRHDVTSSATRARRVSRINETGRHGCPQQQQQAHAQPMHEMFELDALASHRYRHSRCQRHSWMVRGKSAGSMHDV